MNIILLCLTFYCYYVNCTINRQSHVFSYNFGTMFLTTPRAITRLLLKSVRVHFSPGKIVITLELGMCSFQHKWASERQLYLFVLLHHVIMK